MAFEPKYDAGALPFSKLRDDAKLKLVEILDATRGKKLLVLDHIVSGCLGMLTKHTLLVEHGVEQLRYLNDEFQDAGDAKSVVYIVRPTITNFQTIAQQVSRFTRGGRQLDIQAYFQPRSSNVCERIFQIEGIAANIQIGEFPLDFIPFDYDLLSLELQDTVKDVLLSRDWSSQFYMARGLAGLQAVYGPIASIKGIGPGAKSVCDGMEAMINSQEQARTFQGQSSIDELILIDRACDLVTPMCTQLTYEGIIDELLGIKNGTVSYASEGPGPSTKLKMALNSGDETHSFIRSQSITEVGGILGDQAQAIQKGYKESRGAEIKELKEFTTKLKSLPQIQRHIDLLSHLKKSYGRPSFSEKIQVQHAFLGDPATDAEYLMIEEMIFREEDIATVLKFLCLASLTQGGIPKTRFEGLRKEVLTTYGHQHLLTLQRLQAAGLLRMSKGGKPAHQQLNTALRLTPEGNPSALTDVSYVYSGYAPISIRLVEAALRGGGWSGLSDETLKLLPGPHFSKTNTRHILHSPPSDRKKTVVVAFIGGVTYAEIAALRFLQSQPEFDAQFVVATTNFVNSRILMESFQGPEVTAAQSFGAV